jgi:drug/metabolite transporter (DMT)-like permease
MITTFIIEEALFSPVSLVISSRFFLSSNIPPLPLCYHTDFRKHRKEIKIYMKKALIYAIISTICFSSTYIINRMVSLGSADWRWNASLRHFIMFVVLGSLLLIRKQLVPTLKLIKKDLFKWILWSTVGFGLFYSLLTYGSFFGESWLAVGVWQVTIMAGALVTPLFFHDEVGADGTVRKVRNKIPRTPLLFSFIILIGVFILQFQQAQAVSLAQSLRCVIPIILSAFSYTLGNRKTMELSGQGLTASQRVFAMTLCSLPFWIILSLTAVADGAYPSLLQTGQVGIIAISSGCIATSLFFQATSMVRKNPKQLAVVESTTAGEIVFTLLFGLAIGVSSWPDAMGFLGLAIIIIGMLANSFYGIKEKGE